MLRVLNGPRSAFLSVKLRAEHFEVFHLADTVQLGVHAKARACCRSALVWRASHAATAPARRAAQHQGGHAGAALRGLRHRPADGAAVVPEIGFALPLPSPTPPEIARPGLNKTYEVACVAEPEMLVATVDKHRCVARAVLKSKELSRLLGTFHSGIADVSLISLPAPAPARFSSLLVSSFSRLLAIFPAS